MASAILRHLQKLPALLPVWAGVSSKPLSTRSETGTLRQQLEFSLGNPSFWDRPIITSASLEWVSSFAEISFSFCGAERGILQIPVSFSNHRYVQRQSGSILFGN
jgi:hypothetical protein